MIKQKKKKQKLTLSVDSEIVERARKLDINISEITEQVLDSFTFKPNKADVDEIYEKYQEFFSTIIPLLKKFDISIHIGYVYEDLSDPNPTAFNLNLQPNGQFFIEDLDRWIPLSEIKTFHTSWFDSTKEILSELLLQLSAKKEKQDEKIAEIEMARRVVEAISGQLSNKKSSEPKPQRSKKGKKVKHA